MEQRFRDKRGRIIPKIGVNKGGNDYWKNGVSYQNWKYIHPASVRVFAEGWGLHLNRLPFAAKAELKQLYEQDIDSQTALKAVVSKYHLSTKTLPTIITISPATQPLAANIKEFYLEFHDAAANSHKWYAGLGAGDKYLTAHGRIDGHGRAGSISVSNVVHAAKGWKKLTSTENLKIKRGYKVSGTPLNTIPTSYRNVMATKLNVQLPIPIASTSKLAPPPAVGQVQNPTSKNPTFGGLTTIPTTPTPPTPSTPVLAPVTAMTALSFDKHGSKITFPAIVQRKLDGVRCLSWVDANGDVIMMSRRNNPFFGLDHIRNEIKALNLPSNIVLDGELYAHGDKMTFQKLAGLVRRQSVSGADAKEIQKIRYHVYDMIDLNDRMKPFKDRHKFLDNTIGTTNPTYLDVVENFLVADKEEGDKRHSQFVQEGFEGLMFRNIDSPYQGKRSAHLQKYKKFDDAEFKVIGFEEAQGKDAGTVIWVLETPAGEQFRARPKGTLAQRSAMFNTVSTTPATYIGKMMTIKYFGLTDAGIPRFPIAITLRNYE